MDKSLRESILRRDGYLCKACGKPARGGVRHVLSPRLGGSDSASNLVSLCRYCQMHVSPISVDYLLEFFGITEEELLLRKARIEIAIYSWITKTINESYSARRRPRPPVNRRSNAVTRQKRPGIPEKKRLRPRAGKKWIREEDELLLQSFDAGLSLMEIAAALGRGEFSIEVRLWKLGRADLLPGKVVAESDY